MLEQISHCQAHNMRFVLYNLMISGGTASQQTFIFPLRLFSSVLSSFFIGCAACFSACWILRIFPSSSWVSSTRTYVLNKNSLPWWHSRSKGKNEPSLKVQLKKDSRNILAHYLKQMASCPQSNSWHCWEYWHDVFQVPS